MHYVSSTTLLAAALALGTWTSGIAAQDRGQSHPTQHEAGEHHHAEAAKLKNPVKATPESIAEGKKIFEAQCVACHGRAGKGDGKMASQLNPQPSDLTDATWKHGSTDGEIFT